MRRLRPSPALVVSVVGLTVALGGTSYAAFSTSSSKPIVACIHHQGGGLYIARTCAKRDKRLTWNIMGPQGPLGPQGVPGPPGVQGPMGSQGLPGTPAGFTRSGLVTATANQTVPLVSFGPFALTLKCTAGVGSAVSGEIDATSTEANSDGYSVQMTTPGTSYLVVGPLPSVTTPEHNDDNAADFITPSGKAYIADLTLLENYFGQVGTCYANALVSPS